MTSTAAIIQGNESTLFQRVYNELDKSGCPQQTLTEFEKHRNDELEPLIEVCCSFLSEFGYWR